MKTMFVYYKICCFAFYDIGRLLIFRHFVFVCGGVRWEWLNRVRVYWVRV